MVRASGPGMRPGTAVPAGVLLAAGAGTRFGGPKALAVLAGEPLVLRGTRMLRAAGCRPVLAVLGSHAHEVRQQVDLADVEVVLNGRWAEGISTSLRAGLVALRGRAEAAVVALADQPLVTPEVVHRLSEAWRAGASAAVATYGGVAQNPVLLDASLWQEVAGAVRGDEGARRWLQANAAAVVEVECADVASAVDVDVPADLDGLSSSALVEGAPGERCEGC